MNDNNIDNEENHPVQESEQERIAASNDRATATSAEIIKQGLQRAPDDDVLKGRKIDKINSTAKTPAAASVTGTSVAAITNGTTTPSSTTTTTITTDNNKNDDTTIKTDDDNDKKSATTAGPSTTTTYSNPFAAATCTLVAKEHEHKRKRRLKIIKFIQRYDDLTQQTRKETDELVEVLDVDYLHWDHESEQEEIAAAAAADNDTAQRRRQGLISFLQGYDELTEQKRDRTDELFRIFLEKIEDDIIGQFCTLDSDRDTEAQVEAIVQFFPQVLTRRHYMGLYPIQLLAFARNEELDWECNVSRVSFIPLVARLAAKEFGLFEEEERGGLLCKGEHDTNVLHQLMLNDKFDRANVDTKYLQVLIRLRRMGLLKKEDIQNYGLLHILCREDYFIEKRFRFLVEWDPSALTQTNEYGWLPIHCTSAESSIRGLELAFENGILYFPKKKGINLLFREDKYGETPFQLACEKYKPKQVKEIVEDTLIRCITFFDNHASPLNIVDALMMAAIEENVHLDSVYTLIRRQPDILPNILSESDADADADVDATSEVI